MPIFADSDMVTVQYIPRNKVNKAGNIWYLLNLIAVRLNVSNYN